MNVSALAPSLATLGPLLHDVGALKRIRAPGVPSVATALFARAWRRAVAGDDLRAVARETTALAVSASRLGAIDGATLRRAGLDEGARRAIVRSAFDAAATAIPEPLRADLRAHLRDDVDLRERTELPDFVDALAAQPRAGATATGAPRLVLEPTESHAEHCLTVAVYAVLVAPRYDTHGDDAFTLALAHHLHNAQLPDAGFAGETLLGARLDAIVDSFTAEALATLPRPLAEHVADLRTRLLPAAVEPEAFAFHAGDVIDRVLQVRHYAAVAAFEARHALDDLELVHAGPVARFHAGVLMETGLA